MSEPFAVREIRPVLVPIPDDDATLSVDEWLSAIHVPGPPALFDREVWELLAEVRAENE